MIKKLLLLSSFLISVGLSPSVLAAASDEGPVGQVFPGSQLMSQEGPVGSIFPS